ncbi:MAG: ROK family protein [Actinomycetota bacterium]|nr:ROK family protein [Actinomycetota bacterium]
MSVSKSPVDGLVGCDPWTGAGRGQHALAIDIGGTKLAVGVVTAEAVVERSAACPTPHADAEALFTTLVQLVTDVVDSAGVAGSLAVCGVGCGGPMAPGGVTVSPLNIPGWRNFPLRERLAVELGIPVHVDNDAKALALAERWGGAAMGVENFMAMVVSTGGGGGLVVDGRLLHGRLGNAGHIGHVIVEPDGAFCACGAQGCLEAEISGPSISRRIGADPEQAPLHERVRAGTLLGRGVASVANLLDLDLVLVGGSVALGFGDAFFAAAQDELSARSRLDFSRDVRIRPVGLGAIAPLVGAAAVGYEGLVR